MTPSPGVTQTAERAVEPPYNLDDEDDEDAWFDDILMIVIAGFASITIILVVMMLLNGCTAADVLDQPTTPTLPPISKPRTT